jgi:hypothetical protein
MAKACEILVNRQGPGIVSGYLCKYFEFVTL